MLLAKFIEFFPDLFTEPHEARLIHFSDIPSQLRCLTAHQHRLSIKKNEECSSENQDRYCRSLRQNAQPPVLAFQIDLQGTRRIWLRRKVHCGVAVGG